MATIFYSLSGEGRGHATRVRAIVDALRNDHRMRIYAPGDAHHFLEPLYRNTDVPVTEIPGLRFFYTNEGRLDVPGTAVGNARYLLGFRRLQRYLMDEIAEHQPQVVLTDFEPALPRAARRSSVPFISLNHQHFLIVNDLSMLPVKLRRHAFFMRQVVSRYYRGQSLTIVSSFYFPPLKPQFQNVVQVGVILRPAVLAAKPSRQGHLVAYLRKFSSPAVLRALGECGLPVRVYGLGERPAKGLVEFLPINEQGFLDDLASCEALVCTAGNQLVGEALYLGKPVLAMPERNNQEQYINAFFLEREGTGEWVEMDQIDARVIGKFLARADEYRSRIDREKYHGNSLAIEAIHRFLSTSGKMRSPVGASA